MAAHGWSLLETVVALAILGVLLVAAFPYLTPRPMNLRADVNDFVANLRLARDLAISRTTHYRVVVVDRTSYALEKLDWDVREWRPERLVRLRENVRFASATRVGQGVEFDSRGRVVGAATGQVLPFTLEDPTRGEQRSVTVSGAGAVVEQ